MESLGIVTKVKGDTIEVASIREASCGTSCESCAAKCAESKVHTQTLYNSINAEVGDKVLIETNSKNFLRFILLIYGLPLVFFIVGVVSSNFFLKEKTENYQLISFIFGIASMVISYLIIKKIDSNYKDVKEIIVLKRYEA
ncbi:SoxR reducing system RseC family protein [Peptoniphilus catoniae]|uniref:SoxR reducing system RseC family protein n=1 Tax=Peptoniphilus catoniae TaxID=1660341 RepID=UPI0010FEEB2D|nr:SoxR reducing system RseC family protein [Peptoniphilus catoniae]